MYDIKAVIVSFLRKLTQNFAQSQYFSINTTKRVVLRFHKMNTRLWLAKNSQILPTQSFNITGLTPRSLRLASDAFISLFPDFLDFLKMTDKQNLSNYDGVILALFSEQTLVSVNKFWRLYKAF
jgi:hypothetical protein